MESGVRRANCELWKSEERRDGWWSNGVMQGAFLMNMRMVLVMITLCIAAISALAQTTSMHSHFDASLKDHVVNGMVDYEAMKTDKRFIVYVNVIGSTDPSGISNDDERLAFWINAYNAFAIKLVCDNLPLKSINELGQGSAGARDIVWIGIGGKQYSLNQIENEIIRKEFDEPRINFALVCAAKGFSSLRSEAYVPERLDEQLADNTHSFFHDRSKNRYDEETKTLYLSELLKWYGEDFVKKHGSDAAFVMEMLGMKGVKPATVKFLPFDWSLNTQ